MILMLVFLCLIFNEELIGIINAIRGKNKDDNDK